MENNFPVSLSCHPLLYLPARSVLSCVVTLVGWPAVLTLTVETSSLGEEEQNSPPSLSHITPHHLSGLLRHSGL